jgi:hypothetical protein
MSLLPVPVLDAQQRKPAPAPIPPQILTAKRAYVAFAGSEEPFIDDPLFSGDNDRAYNQFYAAMKSWGRYELTGTPGDADLWLEIRFTVPPASRPVSQGNSLGSATFDPQFRVVIRDPKTNAVLWGFTEHVAWAILKGNRDKNFDLALDRILADMQRVSAPAPVAASANQP